MISDLVKGLARGHISDSAKFPIEVIRILMDGKEKVNLSDLLIDAQDLRYLEGFGAVREIDLSCSDLENSSAEILARNPHLKILNLAGNNISDVRCFLENETLIELNLRHNPLDESAVMQLYEWHERRKELGNPIQVFVSGYQICLDDQARYSDRIALERLLEKQRDMIVVRR